MGVWVCVMLFAKVVVCQRSLQLFRNVCKYSVIYYVASSTEHTKLCVSEALIRLTVGVDVKWRSLYRK